MPNMSYIRYYDMHNKTHDDTNRNVRNANGLV